ncbi:MAG: hemerythrin domain-containing protein [Nitriliruptorales bacterium]|nr:hemerythrin domain-containing protein [Nitriliruptorales bacterium]
MDAIEYLTSKHREMEDLLDELEDADDPDRRTELLRDATAELARHMAIEERVLFPAVREELAPRDPETFGDDVLEALEEHRVLKLVLDELTDMDPDDERFPAKAEVLAEQVEHHHEEEEDDLFPALREAWDRARLDQLGVELREAEESAPTRPHPTLPDEGRFVAAAQRFMAAIDKARDAAREAADDLTD